MAGRMIGRTPTFLAGGIILAAVFAQSHPDLIANPPQSARGACDQLVDQALCHVAGTIDELRHDRPPVASIVTLLPDRIETPGAVDPAIDPRNMGSTICDPGYLSARTPRPSWTTAARRRLAAARLPGESPQDFALDQLVPVSLGGAASDARNLWLQSWTGSWNASRKDALETVLHRMVCSGELPLDTAQRAIARDWIETYRRVVTPQNLARHQLSQRWAFQAGDQMPPMPIQTGSAPGPVILPANIERGRGAYEVPAIPVDRPVH